MAEFVETNIQLMVPELNNMKLLELFNDHELSKIVKIRRDFEYKLQRKTKEIKDYLNYIVYETELLRILKRRRREKKCKALFIEIDVCVIKRIHNLYHLACSRFPNYIEIWLKHIEFCKEKREKSRIGVIFKQALKLHSHSKDLWLMYAKYEMEDNRSMDNSRSAIQKAIKFNTESKQLRVEHFRMELLNAEKLIRLDQFQQDSKSSKGQQSIKKGFLAYNVYSQALIEFPGDLSLCLSFIDVCKIFPFASWIEEEIYNDLKRNYSINENVLAAIACRPLSTHIANIKHGISSSAVLEALKQTMENFEEVRTKKDSEILWKVYLDTILTSRDILKSLSLFSEAEHLINYSLMICLEAAELNKMSKKMADSWITILLEKNQIEFALKVISQFLIKYPKRFSLWKFLFDTLVSSDAQEPKLVIKILNEIQPRIFKKGDAIDFWKKVYQWLLQKNYSCFEEFFQLGLRHNCPEVVKLTKIQYLDWSTKHKNVKEIRQLFKELFTNRPNSIELCYIYIKVELSQIKIQADYIRTAYELAISEFGETNIDLWLKYLKFELTHPMGEPLNSCKIYDKAIKNIDPFIESNFIEQYTLMKYKTDK